MEYPKELIQEASLRMNGRPVEGFIAGQGPLHPKLMLVGEAPGKTEIDTHVPFSGQAGIDAGTFFNWLNTRRGVYHQCCKEPPVSRDSSDQ